MTPLGKGHQISFLPAQVREGLLYEGHWNGLDLLKLGAQKLGLLRFSLGLGGEPARALTNSHLELDPLPFVWMIALSLCYGLTRPRTTML